MINFSIEVTNSFLSNDFNIMPDLVVSGNPPVLLIITAEPLLAASKLALPKGSCHLEHTTEILVFFNKSKMKILFLKPITLKRGCLKIIFSLSSSPMTIAFQFLYLSNISIIASPNISYPFALLSLPIKVIIFSFFLKFILTLLAD